MDDAPHTPLPPMPDLDDAERVARARAFYEEMRTRRTVRDFSPEPVPREVVDLAILTAGSAPSGANRQPWFFAVIEDPESRRRVREAAEAEERAFYAGKASPEWLEALRPLGTDSSKPFLESAPVLIAVFALKRGGFASDDARKNYYVTESVGLAVGLLLAALHRAGLATLTHTPAPMGFLNAICGRPETDKPFMLIVAGRPAPGAAVPVAALRKKPLEAISRRV